MSLLPYENLPQVHRADILMKNTVFGLQDHFQFLERGKKYLESPKAIKHLQWEEIADFNEDFPKPEQGIWVQLIEPKSTQENFEAVLRLFLDEGNTLVYEADESNWQEIGSAVRECSHCTNKNGTPKKLYPTQSHAQEAIGDSGMSLKMYECKYNNGWHLTQDIYGESINFNRNYSIQILDRNSEKEWLLLERRPGKAILVLRPNTYQIQCQIKAIQALCDRPKAKHVPLLRLFEGDRYVKWQKLPYSTQAKKIDWLVLTDNSREGTAEQRQFVEIALNTPDFAILEGPPGSGKTTAICELILQLALRGKRILLCASTHVAVDNVLERLMAEENPHREQILPVRIGDNANLSDKVKPYQLADFLRTEKKRLLDHLREAKPLSAAQKMLQGQLQKNNQLIERMVLDAANLVCGTTIGILQHPDIKEKGRQEPQFDVMIIDEASKTTFQEFLVPAVLAERWILVGDPKQLSPYVDDEALAVNVASCLPESYQRNACVDIFLAGEKNMSKRATPLVITNNLKEMDFYIRQAQHQNVRLGSQKNSAYLPFSQIVVGDEDFFTVNQGNLPLDIAYIRQPEKAPDSILRKHLAYTRLASNKKIDSATWESEVSWRLARWYEQRLNDEINADNKTSQKLKKAVEELLPYPDENGENKTWENLTKVRKVALPSILELLQQGFERKDGQREGTALTDGLPKEILVERLVTLSNQHRMHPDIAAFSHQKIYQRKALFSSQMMREKRAWTYSVQKRVIWQDVNGKKNKFNANEEEVKAIIKELQRFDEWAKSNRPTNGGVWEVALLTFYRGQERALRLALRKWTGSKGFRYFHRKQGKTNYMDIQVCTVDRFQGHEADLVLLSFASPHATSFLESPNRLNVAITRARYQLKVFGNRQGLMKSSGVLGAFVKFILDWDKEI